MQLLSSLIRKEVFSSGLLEIEKEGHSLGTPVLSYRLQVIPS